MVDFDSLRQKGGGEKPIDPDRDLPAFPKPPEIKDLYTSQAQVLEAWFKTRTSRDIVVKLHTGGGKTLVGLLVAQSSLTELREPAVYLTPNNQLVQQALTRAKASGIPAVAPTSLVKTLRRTSSTLKPR